MSLFKCMVLNSAGKRHVIEIDGFSKENIIDNLKKNNFIVIDIKYKKTLDDYINLFSKYKKLNNKDMYVFCKKMSSMLKSGINIVMCVDILKEQTENKHLSRLLSEIYIELLTGSTFSLAIAHTSGFSQLFHTLVNVGEISGSMDVVMERLAIHYGNENKVENKIKSALTYPIILAFVSTAVVVFLLINVMPAYVELYGDYDLQLPFTTSLLLNISDCINSYWYFFFLLIGVNSIVLLRLSKINRTKYYLDSLKLSMPIYGALKLKLAASRFSRTLATLVGSGVSMLDGLYISSISAGNEYITKWILNTREDVQQGSSLSYALKKHDIFPSMVCCMLVLGEESGRIDEMLDKIADFYDEEVETAVQKMISMIEPVMIVVMAAIIGFIMFSMITPMFDIVTAIH